MMRSRFEDQCRAEPRQPGEVRVFGQYLGLETLQPRGKSDASIPYLFRTDEPEGRVLGKPLGVVEVFVASQATIDRLPQQVGEAKLRVLPTAVRQMLFDQFAESEPLVEFAHQDQATVRSDAGALELDLERGVEGELKRPFLYLTHWVLTSRTFSPRSHPYEY
jgi:hypothetical protein